MLLLSLNNGVITEEEFLLLNEVNCSKNLIFPHAQYSRFNLENLDETECLREFRVRKLDVLRLADALGLPERLSCYQRTQADKIEGLCLVLKRLAYPCRYSDLIHERRWSSGHRVEFWVDRPGVRSVAGAITLYP